MLLIYNKSLPSDALGPALVLNFSRQPFILVGSVVFPVRDTKHSAASKQEFAL